TGISSFNSGFNVVPFCTEEISPCPLENQQPNVFDKLYYGIKATSGSASQMVVVESNEFEACSRNIYLSGVDDALVTGNDFTGMQFGGYGLYLDASTSFHIEANNFTDSPDAYGIIVNNSGGEPNMVYLNYFDGLKFAINAQNENRAVDGTGLLLKCNEYIDNTFDQVVTWQGGPIMNQNVGIAAAQGANLAAPDAPAGNQFSQTGTTAFSDFYNEANGIDYFYHYFEDDPYRHLPKYRSGGVAINPVTAPWNDYSCPPSDQGGGGGSGDTEEMKSLITLSGQKADSVNAIIAILKDGGSTETLKWEVDMSTPPETYTVYNELMNNSPYISDTVMESAIEKEEVLPNVMIRDVMVANPHNAKDESLLEKIGERNDPMPEYMIAQILQGQSLVSAFENLQSQKAFYEQQHSLALNTLIKMYLSDTLDPAASKDSLKVLLENENSKGAKYRLAFLSMEQGAWSEGLQVLNEIPQQFYLTEEELATHQQYFTFYNLLSGLVQQGKSVTEVDSTQIELLLNIEAMQAGKPSVYARNVLLALEQIEYEEPILLPDLFKAAAVQEERQRIMQSLDEHHYLKLFPNPAGDYLVIEHKLEMEPQKVLVKINNIKGECIIQVELTGKQNQQTVDIHSLKPGIYTATIVADRKELETVKFTKK
ncbi:MAG TPA: NosD domain-containing protein, partial [Bacteroidales bacterium]|nr:NosD domain-containing protein [Bacteroidales bacterium]